MKRFMLICWLCIWLTGCALNPLVALTVPMHPLYVIAGQNAVPGYGSAAISLVDRDTWSLIGTRSFQTSYVHQATSDGQSIWFGLAGDVNNDAAQAVQVDPALAAHVQFETCVEPTGIYHFTEFALVVCRQDGLKGKIQQIQTRTGQLMKEVEVTTDQGDMYVFNSFVYQNELYVNGGSIHSAVTDPSALYVYDVHTLDHVRNVELPRVIGVSHAIAHDDGLLLLNFSSHYQESMRQAFHDVYFYDATKNSVTPLPLIQRSPMQGVILDDYLYTVHFSAPFASEQPTQAIQIFKTNLHTWQQSHWNYAPHDWYAIGDMTTIDGRIFLTKYHSDDKHADGVYELNIDTGELIQRIHIPDASLLVDMLDTP